MAKETTTWIANPNYPLADRISYNGAIHPDFSLSLEDGSILTTESGDTIQLDLAHIPYNFHVPYDSVDTSISRTENKPNTTWNPI